MDDALGLARFSLILVAILGAIIGSFLNVVIYRLPRGLSVTNPRWSFCPSCQVPIRFYDNVPILSWLCLRRRCRRCGAGISCIYPLIECLTVLVFVSLWDAVITARIVPGAGRLAADWPVIIGYLVLFGGLLAGAAMDIESYVVDIRICIFTVVVGAICHGLRWALPGVAGAHQPFAAPTTLPPALSLIGLVMLAAWLLTALCVRLLHRAVRDDGCKEQPRTADGGAEPESQPAPRPAEVRRDTTASLATAAIIALFATTLALLCWQIAAPQWRIVAWLTPGGQRGFVTCLLCMVSLLVASMEHRPSDSRIVAEIEAERSGARRMAVGELAYFVPSMLAGIAVLVILRRIGHAGDGWPEAIRELVGSNRAGLLAAGALHASAAAVLAAAIGWAVRILGTLTFGKEAFGTGDIYIMAAIGAVGGLPLLLFGFFLAAILALIGVLVCFFWKSSRAVPFGPWLALGALVGLWLQPTLLTIFKPAASLVWAILSGQPQPWLTAN